MEVQRHYRCVVLVIAHRDPAYTAFRAAWDEHWDAHPERACFYLYNDPECADPRAEGADLTFPYAETYPAPGLLLKTLAALDYLRAAGVTYDYLLRTNLSSLFDWPRLDAHLRTAPRTWYAAGVQYEPEYIAGLCLLLSADLVADLAAHRDALDFAEADDAAIARFLHARHPDLTYVPVSTRSFSGRWPETVYLEVAARRRPPLHYRFHRRGFGLYGDRAIDAACMRAAHRALCPPVERRVCRDRAPGK